MHITITLANEYRQQQFIAGAELSAKHTLSVPLADLSPASRAYLARISPTLADTALVVKERVGHSAWPAPLLPATGADWDTLLAAHAAAQSAQDDKNSREEEQEREKDTAQLDAAIVAATEAVAAGTGTSGPVRYVTGGRAWERLPRAAEYAALRAALKAQDTAREQAERARREADAARRDEEKAAWIASHGSAFLQRASGAGYDCQRRYFEERAALEYPSYYPDFDDRVFHNPRACPSEAALTEAERVGGRVVWLRAPLPGDEDIDMPDEDDPDWEPRREAVVVGFLGHEVIKVI